MIGSAANNAIPERRIIKFNNKIYPFNNANISFNNLVAASGNNNANNINLNNNYLNGNNNNNFNPPANLTNSLKGANNALNSIQNQEHYFNANFSENNFSLSANANSNSNNPNDILDDQSLENLLEEVGQYKTKDEIKAYLKNKITSLISKFNSHFKFLIA